MEERHIHPRQHIEDSLAVRMGGRAAELLVYGDLSTGASNDLVGNTELARKMVREWGMSDKIGPMAWGSQGQVFLGEDLMHTRDYSEHTSQVIDDEVEIILREQEQRALEVLARHRGGLDALARALLDEETVDGETVARLVDTAYGKPVHPHGAKSIPPVFVAEQHGPTGSGNADGTPDEPSTGSGPSGSDSGAAPAAEGGVPSSSDERPAEESGTPADAGVSPAQQTPPPNAQGPWPPPTAQPGSWPQAPSPWPPPPQAPGHWPHQAPWPPPPPPPPASR